MTTDPRDEKYTPADGSPRWEYYVKPVPWSEVAKARGHTIDEYTQYGDLTPHPAKGLSQPGDYFGPLEETPTGAMIDAVGDAVLSFSGERQECIVAVWSGYGTREIDDCRRQKVAKIKGMGSKSTLSIQPGWGS